MPEQPKTSKMKRGVKEEEAPGEKAAEDAYRSISEVLRRLENGELEAPQVRRLAVLLEAAQVRVSGFVAKETALKTVTETEDEDSDDDEDGMARGLRSLTTLEDDVPAARRRKVSSEAPLQDGHNRKRTCALKKLERPPRDAKRRRARSEVSLSDDEENPPVLFRKKTIRRDDDECKSFNEKNFYDNDDDDTLDELSVGVVSNATTTKKNLENAELLSLTDCHIEDDDDDAASETTCFLDEKEEEEPRTEEEKAPGLKKEEPSRNISLGKLSCLPPEVTVAIFAKLNAGELGRLECCCRATRGSPGLVDLAVLRVKRFQYGVKTLPLLNRETWPKILQRWEWTRSSRSLSTRMDGVAAAFDSLALDLAFTVVRAAQQATTEPFGTSLPIINQEDVIPGAPVVLDDN